MLVRYLLLELFEFEVLLVSVALVVVSESVDVSELEFRPAELANSVAEAVEGESVQFAVLWFVNYFVESILSFIFGNGFRHVLFFRL